DNARSRWRVSDDPTYLAREYTRVFDVALFECFPETLHYSADVPLHLLLAIMPLGNEAVVQDANHEFRIRPIALSGHVHRPRLRRRAAIGLYDRLTEPAWRFRLLGRDEARTDQNAVRAEHQRRSKSATISDPTCRDQHGIGRMLGEIVGGLWHE